jgi:urate oxidase
MPARLAWNGYGKAAVRLVTVARTESRHDLNDLTVDVQLQGEFAATHACGDNSAVLPTDTMKNTVYALASTTPVDPPESFGLALARHFLGTCTAAQLAVIRLEVHSWERLAVGETPHDHAFRRGPAARRTVEVSADRDIASVSAGIEALAVLKTTGSGFEGFLRDQYTTLPDTADRILATEVSAQWRYDRHPTDWSSAWLATRNALLETFAQTHSRSVQETLFAMGAAALAACPEIAEIRLILPNQHHLLVDLNTFGLRNANEVFVATREPYGRIEGVVVRE